MPPAACKTATFIIAHPPTHLLARSLARSPPCCVRDSFEVKMHSSSAGLRQLGADALVKVTISCKSRVQIVTVKAPFVIGRYTHTWRLLLLLAATETTQCGRCDWCSYVAPAFGVQRQGR